MRSLRLYLASIVSLAALALCCVCPSKASVEIPKECTGCNFSGQKLENGDFSNGTYVGSNFANAHLRGSSFTQAQLVAANFQDADLRNVRFDGMECTACNFQGAHLDGATFNGVRVVAANFVQFHADIADDQLRELLARCVSCNFQQSLLAGRDLSGLTLISVDFSGADLRNAKFDGSALCWYSVNGSKRQTNCDKMNGAQLSGASFQNIVLCREPTARVNCTNVDAGTLRNLSGGEIDGIEPPAASPTPRV